MTDLQQYLLPDNKAALLLVVLLTLTFLYWLFVLLKQWRLLRGSLSAIEACKDIGSLEDTVAQRFGNSESDGEINVREVFGRFLSACGLHHMHPIAVHIKAIFYSGCRAATVDVSSLLRHTENELFRPNAFLRTLMGTFIVLGLLGTLFGLTDSLAQLYAAATSTSSAAVSFGPQQIQALLGHLKGAFLPSIVGVTFTVLSVIAYGLYFRLACAPVRSALELNTLTIWVPRLILTTPARLLDTLEKSEGQMRRNFEAAERVAQFAKEIEDEAGDLQKSLKGTNKNLKLLAESSASLNSFAHQFNEAAGHLTTFQQELKGVYSQLDERSDAFYQRIQDSVVQSNGLYSVIAKLSEEQSTRLQEVLQTLHLYEEGYLRHREQIDAAIREVLRSTEAALHSLEERNKDIVETLGNPVISQLNDMKETLRVQLERIRDQFQSFDVPIKTASDTVAGALDSVVRRTEQLNNEFHREFADQNTAFTDQLRRLNETVAAIPAAVDNLTTVTERLQEHVKKIGQASVPAPPTVSGSSGAHDGRKEPVAGSSRRQRGGYVKRIMEAITGRG